MRINIEIGDIEAFIELTETNSFAKAANNLNLSQPALSRRIQKLEHELGTTLFDRTTRKVQLSYSGRNFYDRARGIIEAVKTATKTLNEKYDAIVNLIQECINKNQPCLGGTVSIEKSESLSKILKKKGINHQVLNAKNHLKEA